MLTKIGHRQYQILERFLNHKQGLCVEDLANELNISRTAVQQHFHVLERDGCIEKNNFNKTAGRPVTLYVITNKGINYFPKHYAWFAGLMLEDLKETLSSEQFETYMTRLGEKLAHNLRGQFEGKSLEERFEQLTQLMSDLGFHLKPQTEMAIEANNCIFHDLAQKNPEICAFDIALIEKTLNHRVKRTQCMAEGDCVCQFKMHAN